MKKFLKNFNNFHLPSSSLPDVFIFGCARSGTTLMHEIINTQASFKPSKVPFDLRYAPISDYMANHGINTWADYYDDAAEPVIKNYINGIRSGKIIITDPFFFNNFNRLLTKRVVFKILHSCEDRIHWFEKTFDSKIVYMIRHPIPVAYSRWQIPRLNTFIESRYNRFFTNEQISYARNIERTGNHMQHAVLDWAFQNSVALRNVGDDWTVVSYEQLVLDSEPVLKRLSEKLKLADTKALHERLFNPSASTKWSDEKTNSVLLNLSTASAEERAKYNEWLVHGKWRDKITQEELKQVSEILDVFEVDLYSADSPLPHARLWMGDNYHSLSTYPLKESPEQTLSAQDASKETLVE